MKATLVESHELAPEVRHFVFEVPEIKNLPFQPGQFVSFEESLRGKKITRAYSIASRPDGNRFELCLNLVHEGTFSPHLFALKPGESVEMAPPLGFFVLRNPAKSALFVATGTGIAPFRSMAPDYLGHSGATARTGPARPSEPARNSTLSTAPGSVVRASSSKELTLLFGVRYHNSIYYRDEFEALEQRYPNFHFWPTLSRPEPSWGGRSGHVQNHLLEALGDRRDLDVYICGLKAMVDDVRAILKSLGFDRKQILFEKYD
jgi:ferredoxin-NADP reductase